MNEAIREVLGDAGAPPLPEPLAGSIVDLSLIHISEPTRPY